MKTALLFTFIIICSLFSFSQTDTSTVEKKELYLVVKTDGNEFYGFILEDDGREILLETKTIGKIYINKSEISKIEKIEDVIVKDDGELEYKDYRGEGAFTTRYYFTTNALPIKKKDNYALIQLYGPEIHFAVNDNFSVGVMASWIASPIALAMKYSFNSTSKTHLAFGTIVGSSGYLLNGRGYGGLHWLTVTHGDRMSNISFSAGYAYAGGVSDLFYRGNYFEGAKIQSYDVNAPYYNDSYNAASAVHYKYPGFSTDYSQNFNGAAAVGISGILPIGKKASFIFDSMTFLSKDNSRKYNVEYTSTTEEFTYNEWNSGVSTSITEDITFGKGKLVESGLKGVKATIVLMPAMRFSTAHDASFQVALAGVINASTFGGGNAFPAPMVSWLRKF